MPDGPQQTHRLTATERSVLGSGSTNGHEWTLYGYSAVRADGTEITEKLVSLDAIPLHQEVEVEVEVREHAKYGRSLSLKMPKAPSLRERVDELEERVRRLEER